MIDKPPAKVTWLGGNPTNCDTCDAPIEKRFYDANTTLGAWATMCPTCFTLGPGCGKLGSGFGQQYDLQKSGRFIKTGG